MAEQACNRRLSLLYGQGTLSRCQHLDDGPLHHAIAEPSYVELRLRTRSRLDRLVWQGLEHRLQGTGGV